MNDRELLELAAPPPRSASLWEVGSEPVLERSHEGLHEDHVGRVADGLPYSLSPITPKLMIYKKINEPTVTVNPAGRH
ncbi:TPA: hypothetical protein NJH38_000360 [Pseudomonas aeruginosa]|nr:hypothetical protein [Pseudomonas aeruginosa]